MFVKTAADAAPGGFAAEAAGLAGIAAAGGSPPVPEVLAVGDDFLALSWIDCPWPRDDEAFGRGLAALHRAGADWFGQLPPGVQGGPRIGALRPGGDGPAEGGHGANGRYGDHNSHEPPGSWAVVDRDERLMPLARQGFDHGSLWRGGLAAVDGVCDRLDWVGRAATPDAEGRYGESAPGPVGPAAGAAPG